MQNIEFLSYENVDFEELGIVNTKSKSILDLIVEGFIAMDEREALHYSEIIKLITSKDIPIPGGNPEANLLIQISREERFVSIAPATYGLKEWGLVPMRNKTKYKKRR